MNKKIKYGVLIAITIAIAYASLNSAPTVNKFFEAIQTKIGNEILHPGGLLKDYSYFSSTTEAVICTGKCALFDVITASGADGSYAIIRDTATADGSGSYIVSKLEFDGTGIAKSLAAGNPNAFPIVTTKGISVDLSSVSSGEQLLVIYKDLD